MAWVNFFNVLACLPWTIYQTSVLVLWICLSVLFPSLSETHLSRKATELMATPDVMQEAVSELQEEMQPGTKEKAGWRWWWCILHPSLVWQCQRLGQTVGTQAAAHSHPLMSPAAEHATGGMKGWSGKARLVGKHLGWNHASLFFWPLSKRLSFAMSAHSDSGTE